MQTAVQLTGGHVRLPTAVVLFVALVATASLGSPDGIINVGSWIIVYGK